MNPDIERVLATYYAWARVGALVIVAVSLIAMSAAGLWLEAELEAPQRYRVDTAALSAQAEREAVVAIARR